jgi:hypothetical protein
MEVVAGTKFVVSFFYSGSFGDGNDC